MNLKFIDGKFILLVGSLVLISLLYGVYKDRTNKSDEEKHYQLVREYLLNESPFVQKKPILWIHLDYRINAREWESFNSRNTNNLNQPYLFLTIKSIIDKCGENFNICIIDDNTFVNILPRWNVELNKVANPIKDKLRILALMNVLKLYGGMLLPASFLCIKDLHELYEEGTENNKMFAGDLLNTNVTSNDNHLHINNKLIGCKKDCEKMKEYISYIENVVSRDYTDESNFTGSIDNWLEMNMKSNEINIVSSDKLGLINSENNIITLDNLMNNTYYELHNDAYGIYIPSDEILTSKKYQWFARLSKEQILTSNTLLGKYILTNIQN